MNFIGLICFLLAFHTAFAQEPVTEPTPKTPPIEQETTTPAVPEAPILFDMRWVKETPAVPTVETPAVPTVEIPAEPVVEAPVEPPVEIPTEPVAEVPVEPPVEIPTEPVAEIPAEPLVEAPIEYEPIDTGMEISKKSSNDGFYSAVFFDLVGAGFITYGVIKHFEAKDRHDEYMKRNQDTSYYDAKWNKVEKAQKARDKYYIIGIVSLGFGVSAHIFF